MPFGASSSTLSMQQTAPDWATGTPWEGHQEAEACADTRWQQQGLDSVHSEPKFGVPRSAPSPRNPQAAVTASHQRLSPNGFTWWNHLGRSHQEQVLSFLGKPALVQVPKQAEPLVFTGLFSSSLQIEVKQHFQLKF